MYIMNSQHYKLGRIVNHDPRSKNFGLDTSALKIVDVEHKRLIPILNQGQVGACTGNAGIGAINTEPFTLNTKTYTPDEAGALKLYSDAEKLDGGAGYPPEDQGSSGLSIAKILKKAGLISGYQHTFTLNDALKALGQYPIITGTNWHANMFNPDPDGRVHPTGTIEGGHEYEGYKIDTKLGRIWFHNSWGTDWGVNGDFYLTWADYATLLAQSGDVMVMFPPTTTPPAPSPYIYFKPSEVVNLQVPLVQMLDKARGISNTPYVITSGFRTPEQNSAVGGEPNSSHLRGLAADIACTNTTRQAVLKGLLTCGTPVFIECATAHIHVDIDPSIHTLGDMIVSQKE